MVAKFSELSKLFNLNKDAARYQARFESAEVSYNLLIIF